jgi:hypothetical protein
LDIHWNDVDISIETVETLEEIENNSDGSGSCLVTAVVSARRGCTNLWYKRFCVQRK